MSDHIYKRVELVGTSRIGIEDAVNNALAKANQTIHSLRWFEVLETRGQIEQGSVQYWQVTVRVGFTLDDGD